MPVLRFLFRPPFVAAGLVGVAWLVSDGLALPVLFGFPWRHLAWGVVLLGVALAVAGLERFHRAGTPHDPYAQPEALVTGGVYRFTRNPMYLGLTVVLVGLAVWIATWPAFLVPPVFLLVIRVAFVPREERRLEARFAAAYLDYKARVRRWL
ncbi:MAG: isoprenylcysteine carboxylmethyltransferase family protein [Planctomycetota bacterium]|nr:isoprenylcysteine carboxylmethyltransferase family protein [Planctomycetota bacterium]